MLLSDGGVFKAAGDTLVSSGVPCRRRKLSLLVTIYQEGETSFTASLLLADLRSMRSYGLTPTRLCTSESVQVHTILIYLSFETEASRRDVCALPQQRPLCLQSVDTANAHLTLTCLQIRGVVQRQ